MFFVSCSTKGERVVEVTKQNDIYDLKHIPQNIKEFTKNTDTDIKMDQSKFENHYFSVWNIQEPSQTLQDIKWPFRSYTADGSYGENLKPLDEQFFENMYKNSNFQNYLKVNKKALTLKLLNIRAFPTSRPLLRDPSRAGEGFPFDYLQNSTIAANKPVLISHFSKDKEWAYIFCSFASGWVKSGDIVVLDPKYTKEWQKAREVFFTKDDVPVYSLEGDFLFDSRIGMMLPLIKEDKDSYTVLVVSKYKNQQPLYLEAKLSKDIAHEGVLRFNAKNLNKIIGNIFYSKYGWGGAYEQRDCSSTIRDIFIPFGIWLPRNSSQQAKVGKVVSLEGLSDDEKLLLIKKEAIPFETLLHKKGHIALYVGLYNNDIVILHNTWGIKTKHKGRDGRIVIGKVILSTLKLGQYQKDYDENSSILRKIDTMNIIVQ